MKGKAIKGIALVEVLISIVVLSFGITAMLFAYRNIITLTKKTSEMFYIRLNGANFYSELFSGFYIDKYNGQDEIVLNEEKNVKVVLNSEDYIIKEADETDDSEPIAIGRNIKADFMLNGKSVLSNDFFVFVENNR